MFDIVKWLTSLNSAAQKLLACLFIAIGTLVGVIIHLDKRIDQQRAEFKEESEKKDQKIFSLVKEKEEVSHAWQVDKDTCQESMLKLVNTLWKDSKAEAKEQREINEKTNQQLRENKSQNTTSLKMAERIKEVIEPK